jgi:hypothetical protein
MGLAVGAGIYVLMRRAGVPRPWAALASAPILLDGNEIELEHMMMAETLFTFLAVVSVALLLWRPRPSWPACLAVGLLTGYAVIVRTEGVTLPLVLAGYLVLRRAGWRPLAAVVAGCATPVAAYVFWFHSQHGQYALTRSEGIYLWGRVSSFADCTQIKPPAPERRFCLSTPVAKRRPPGAIIWSAPQVRKVPGGAVSPHNNTLLRDFAVRAILAQPASYLGAIADDVGLALNWRRYPYPSEYSASLNEFHLKPQVVPDRSWIPGGTAVSDVRAYGRASPSRVVRPVAFLIAGYQRVFYTWGPLFGAILAIGLGGLIRFRRRPGGEGRLTWITRHAPGLLPWVTAMVLLIGPIALAGFSYRYLMPVLPFSCLAAGLAAAPRRPAGPAGPTVAAAPAAEPRDTETRETETQGEAIRLS